MVKESTEKNTRIEEQLRVRNMPSSDALAPQSPGYLPIWLYEQGFDKYKIIIGKNVQDFLNMSIDRSIIQQIQNGARN